MKVLVDKMRADFNRLMAFRLDSGEWSRADANEHGQAIRSVIDDGKPEQVKAWAVWVGHEVANYFGTAPALPVRHTPACAICRHLTRPGRAEPGYCNQRPDQAPAFGPGHPLNQLPSDGGKSCTAWSNQ